MDQMKTYEYEIVDSCAKSKYRGYRHIYLRRWTRRGERMEYLTMLDYPRVYDGVTDRCGAMEARRRCGVLQRQLQRAEVMRALAVSAGMIVDQSACLHGDALAAGSRTVMIRYDHDWKKTGVALRMPRDLSARYGQWEHGRTRAEAREEIRVKRARSRADQIAIRASRLERRRVHLVGLLCRRLIVSYAIARPAGLCDAGIRAYCTAHGLDVEHGATVGVLRDLIAATGDGRPLAAIELAARALVVSHA